MPNKRHSAPHQRASPPTPAITWTICRPLSTPPTPRPPPPGLPFSVLNSAIESAIIGSVLDSLLGAPTVQANFSASGGRSRNRRLTQGDDDEPQGSGDAVCAWVASYGSATRRDAAVEAFEADTFDASVARDMELALEEEAGFDHFSIRPVSHRVAAGGDELPTTAPPTTVLPRTTTTTRGWEGIANATVVLDRSAKEASEESSGAIEALLVISLLVLLAFVCVLARAQKEVTVSTNARWAEQSGTSEATPPATGGTRANTLLYGELARKSKSANTRGPPPLASQPKGDSKRSDSPPE